MHTAHTLWRFLQMYGRRHNTLTGPAHEGLRALGRGLHHLHRARRRPRAGVGSGPRRPTR